MTKKETDEKEWEQFKRDLSSYIDYMVAYPQEIMRRYPRYREVQKDLANAFFIEILQAENPQLRHEIESGQRKRAKVFVDIAWDGEAFDKWKREEDVRRGIATSMMDEMIPPNFMEMSERERDKHFEENWEKIQKAVERLRKRTRYTGP